MVTAVIPLSVQGTGLAAIVPVKAHHKNVPVGGVYTGVDGFVPIIHTTAAGVHEAWMIGHHAYDGVTKPRVTCVNLETGVRCKDAGGSVTTWPKPLNTAAGPLGSGSTGDLATTESVIGQLDGANRVDFPAVTTTALPGFPNGSAGVGCLDMETQSNCGFTPLAGFTNAPGTSNVNGIGGLSGVGTKLYGPLTDGRIACFDQTTHAACPGQPYASDTPPNTDKAGLAPNDFIGTTRGSGTRIYIASNPQAARYTLNPKPPTVSCFDTVTNTSCASFTAKTPTNPSALFMLALTRRFDTTGAEIGGICAFTGNQLFPAPVIDCYDANGNPVDEPPGLVQMFPPSGRNSVIFRPLTVTIDGEVRTYFSTYTEDRVHLGFTVCYDWNTQSACDGFPGPLANQNTNGGDTHPYGFGYRPDNNCLYGHGDTGYLFSENATTGSFGC